MNATKKEILDLIESTEDPDLVLPGEGKPARVVELTWVEVGTNNAACLGIDETIDIKAGEDINITQIRDAAYDYAANDGIDLDRYAVEIEVFDGDSSEAYRD